MQTSKYQYHFPDTLYVQINKKDQVRKNELKGTKRVVKLFIFCALLPGVLLTVPLYLRFRVYIQQVYPIGASDMRIIDNKISTTWCQKQLIISNTTFNAYVIANEPEISKNYENIDMRRSIILKDGVKEYWGFYLLKGSSFDVSACVSWPGASLIVIEGHKNLKECAYIGDNSSEERLNDSVSSEEDKNVTFIDQMTKLSPGVVLHRWSTNKTTTSDAVRTSRAVANGHSRDRADHEHDHSTTASPKSTASSAIKMGGTSAKTSNVHLIYAEEIYRKDRRVDKLQPQPQSSSTAQKNDSRIERTNPHQELTDILNRLKSLGPYGKIVLQKLNKNASQSSPEMDDNSSSETLLKLEQIIEELFEKKNKTRGGRATGRPSSAISTSAAVNETAAAYYEKEFFKLKKQMVYHRAKNLNLDLDDEANTGQEMFDENDKSDLHGSMKHTKHRDQSKSEFWSSFSSSEEILLDCKGLLVSLPLIPNNTCNEKGNIRHLDEISRTNSVFYKVQTSGYYFFIFNNENEIENNFIHAHFELKKTVYNTSDAVVSCKNETKECSLPLTFWSRQRTILELPSPMDDDASWNQEFIFVSKCEPRSILYLICIFSVPVCILLFAFS